MAPKAAAGRSTGDIPVPRHQRDVDRAHRALRSLTRASRPDPTTRRCAVRSSGWRQVTAALLLVLAVACSSSHQKPKASESPGTPTPVVADAYTSAAVSEGVVGLWPLHDTRLAAGRAVANAGVSAVSGRV